MMKWITTRWSMSSCGWDATVSFHAANERPYCWQLSYLPDLDIENKFMRHGIGFETSLDAAKAEVTRVMRGSIYDMRRSRRNKKRGKRAAGKKTG